MNDYDRCAWSDLPTIMCAHCTPGPRGAFTLPKRRLRVLATVVQLDTVVDNNHGGRHLPEDVKTWELLDYTAALCDWTKHAEPRDTFLHNSDGSITPVTTRHVTSHAPLIVQLWAAAEKSRGMESGSRVFGSSPSAALEALDVALDIETQVHNALRRHGLVNSHDDYPETINAVRHLSSIADGDDAHMIRRWWSMARVVTGWDKPAFKPDNTCPICGVRGSLRIRVTDAFPTALCVECRQTWDAETIGHLALHMRAENHEDDDAGDTPASGTA